MEVAIMHTVTVVVLTAMTMLIIFGMFYISKLRKRYMVKKAELEHTRAAVRDLERRLIRIENKR